MANENIVGQVEDLLQRYQSALAKATGLIELKDQLIELLEDEIRVRKRQNLILASILIACLIAFAFITSLYCIL
jgi:hypothetical protein